MPRTRALMPPALIAALFVSACNMPGGSGSICATPAVLASMMDGSGFMTHDPIRGGVMPAGMEIAVTRVTESERLNDRVVCDGQIELTGPRGALTHHILKSQWSADDEVRFGEAARGYASLPIDMGDYETLVNMPDVGMDVFNDLTLAPPSLDDSAITIKAPIQYSVSKNPELRVEPIAWTWAAAGQTPGYFAGQHLAGMIAIRDHAVNRERSEAEALAAPVASASDGTGCASGNVLNSLIQNSEIQINDPVTGLASPTGFSIDISEARPIERLPDRKVCTAVLEIAGPRAALVKQVLLKAPRSGDHELMHSDMIAGYESLRPAGEAPPSDLQDMSKFMIISFAVGSLSSTVDTSQISFQSLIEYSIETGPDRSDAPTTWTWAAVGKTPWYQAARHLAELTAPDRDRGQ